MMGFINIIGAGIAKITDTTDPTLSGANISVSGLVATGVTVTNPEDNVGVTGFMIRGISTKPSASATGNQTDSVGVSNGWKSTSFTDCTFTADAAHASPGVSLYVFLKDAAGNVSTGAEVTGNVFTSGGVAVSDTFTRSDAATLGTNYTQLSGTDARFGVGANRATSSASGSQSAGDYWSANAPTSNHYCEANTCAISVRMQTAAESCYALYTDSSDDEGWITINVSIKRMVNGVVAATSATWTTEGEGIELFSGIWRLEALGSTIVLKTASAHNDNGTTGYTTRITWTESALQNGSFGLYGNTSIGVGTTSADNLYGGDVV